MKSIEIDDDLYAFIASQTKQIGESASDILHRLLLGDKPIPVETVVSPIFDNQPAKPVTKRQEVEQTQPMTSDVAEQDSATSSEIDGGEVFDVLAKQGLNEENSRVENFLQILSALHATNASDFSKVLSVKGRNRIYFSTSKAQLLEAGSSTNPKQVPDSDYWVVTNNNTAKKVSMLSQVALTLGYSNKDTHKLATLFAPELN